MELSGETLLGVRIFSTLDRNSRSSIAARCRIVRATTGTEVVCYGEESREVYFLVSGEVRATLLSSGGKEVAFRDLGPGETFGDMSAIDGEDRCASVVVLEDAIMAAMTDVDFRLTFRAYPDVAEAVMRDLTALARSLTERIVQFSTQTVSNRIHAEILRIASSQASVQPNSSIVVPSPPTHESIAHRIGTQREAVTKELSRLRKKGVLEVRPGVGWLIPDLQALRVLTSDKPTSK